MVFVSTLLKVGHFFGTSSTYSHLTIPQITHYWPSSSFLQVPTRKKGWEIIRSIATNLRGGGGGGGGGGCQILCFVKVTHGKMIVQWPLWPTRSLAQGKQRGATT